MPSMHSCCQKTGLGLVLVAAIYLLVADRATPQRRKYAMGALLVGAVTALLCMACVPKYRSAAACNVGDVVMYSMRGCGYCVRAKETLDKAGIRYKEIEYVPGADAKPELMPNGQRPQGFPTFVVDGAVREGGSAVAEDLAKKCPGRT